MHMSQIRKLKMSRPWALAFACMMLAALVLAAAQTASAVVRMPDVSKEMTKASYWSDKQPDADAVLADRSTIDQLNQDGIDADGTMLQPLKDAAERFYTKEEQQRLKGGVEGDLAYFLSVGAEDVEGNALTEEEAAEIAANCPTDGSTPQIASGYAIVTTHTTMRNLPTDRMMGETPGDADDDNLYLSMLRVNEPLLVRAASVDGKFLLCISSCLQVSWVPTEDVAICKDRDEWLEAWDIPEGEELVVTGYKVRTEQSRVTKNTANRLLYMGTVLQRVDKEDARELVGTRSIYNNHVCYLPVRDDDGNYSRELALIAESEKVSEGFLPLTSENISKVAFNALGQMYGWGGMLEADDCSGYVRDVYKCFGLELARNTTWQMNLPVRQYDLEDMDDAHKAAAIAQMPLGTVLFWGGHEMLYLGQEDGKLYVISAVGSVGDLFDGGYGATQVKGVVVNTLDMVRGNRNTWLQTLTKANVPYVPQSDQGTSMYDIAFYEGTATWPDETFVETGSAIEPEVAIPFLEEGADYTVSFKDNVEPGTATVTIAGAGDYSGAVSRTFEILPASIADATVSVKNVTYTGKAQKPKPTVKLGGTTLELKKDYTVSYADNVDVGTATVTVKGTGRFTDSVEKTFKIKKAAQAIKAKNAKKTVKLKKGEKKLAKTKRVSLKKLAGVSAKTAVSYTRINKDGRSRISVNTKTGDVALKAGLKKGAYKVKVKLRAAADDNYKAAKAKTVTLKVVVK